MTTPERLRQALRVLAGGGLVAHPTEGVWGLACNPLDAQAVMGLLAAKRRDPAKGLILVAADAETLTPYLAQPPPTAARESWPGPVTWVLPAAPALPWWLSGGRDTVAVRVTAHVLTAELCRAWASTGRGALVSTSANVAGRAPALHSWQARRAFGETIDLVLAGALDHQGRPSAIRDAAGATLRP